MPNNPPAFKWLENLMRYHETGGHEGDGSDHAMRMARAELEALKRADKLDYFAGQALAGAWASQWFADHCSREGTASMHEALAANLYDMADAMITESESRRLRGKQGGE